MTHPRGAVLVRHAAVLVVALSSLASRAQGLPPTQPESEINRNFVAGGAILLGLGYGPALGVAVSGRGRLHWAVPLAGPILGFFLDTVDRHACPDGRSWMGLLAHIGVTAIQAAGVAALVYGIAARRPVVPEAPPGLAQVRNLGLGFSF